MTMRFEDSVPFEWLDLAKNSEITIDGDDIDHEAHDNLWGFSPADDQLARIDRHSVARFINEIIRYRQDSLRSVASGKLLFYCWHDAMARQLRFSLVSISHGRLPFGCKLKKTSDVLDVVDMAVERDWKNMDWGSDEAEEHDSLSMHGLTVFTCLLV